MAPSPLISSRVLEQLQAQLKTLSQRQNRRSRSHLSGAQRSAYRGAGMELQELRGYEFGDDIRHIAWRSSAKTGRPMVKLFQAERQSRALVCVEQHDTMYFATRGELKAATAVRATALLCFNARLKQTEVGGLTWSAGEQAFPFSNRLEQTLALLRSINTDQPPRHRSDPHKLITQLQQLASRHCDIYLISDFSHWQTPALAALTQLAAHHRLHAVQIVDRGEQVVEDVGRLRVIDPDSGRCSVIDTGNPQLRQRYAAAMQERQAQLAHSLKQAQVAHIRCYTDAPPLQALEPLL